MEDNQCSNNIDKIVWCDERGWIYFVRSGIGESSFKGFYAKNEQDYRVGIRQHGIGALGWEKTFMEAQASLNEYAKKKKWRVFS